MRTRAASGAIPSLVLGVLVASCAGAAPPQAAGAPGGRGASAAARAGSGSTSLPGALVTPSRLMPDPKGDRGLVADLAGERRLLLDRMRVITRPGGAVERAAELFPFGELSTIPLPSRLGGGFLFHVATGAGARLWRSATWLGRLEPLVQLSFRAAEIIPGFDRLYVRMQQGGTSGRLFALDAATGEAMPLGPLPPASSYGPLAFVDGWRAVVDTDLRGPLATFDAGASFRPVGVRERVAGLGVDERGDPVVMVSGGRFTVSSRGVVTYRPDAPRAPGAEPQDEQEPSAKPPGPLGPRPLRAAVEDGWPDTATTAVVARNGALARVSLRDGSVVAASERAFPERQASCRAVPLGARGAPGSGVGFVCGEPDGPTVVYAYEPPLGMRPVLRFSRPRFVAASGNGSSVVRGGCADPPAPAAAESRTYCVRSPDGSMREIAVVGDVVTLGAERVVGLSDGRVAVLIPPQNGGAGQLKLLGGSADATVALRLPTTPKAVVRELRRGMWLEGFEEREPGVLGGWVEAGGPLVGVRVKLDGAVGAGEQRDQGGNAILSGRFGFALRDDGGAAETTDGGFTWEKVDLPERDDDRADAATRACGPVGCALRGWIRVGWGKPAIAGDLEPAESPKPLALRYEALSSLSMRCEVAGSVTPPLRAKPPRNEPAPEVVAPRGRLPGLSGGFPAHAVPRPLVTTGWSPFRNVAPPALAPDEAGFDNGPVHDLVGMRAYAWGRRGADWSRAGRLLVRFDDRFDPAGGVRSSAVTASPWGDEAAAAEAVGTGGATWSAYPDPGGRAALVALRRGPLCALYAVADGQPVLPVRDARRSAGIPCPVPFGAVRDGEAWVFLSPSPSNDGLVLWRAELGVARQIATYYRPQRYAGVEAPRVVRRALGGGVGLSFVQPALPGQSSGMRYVLPVDAENGELGEPVAIGRRDLSGALPPRCGDGQDGWLFEAPFEDAAPGVELAGAFAPLDSFAIRLRADAGFVCTDGLAARVDGLLTRAGGKQGGAAAAPPPGRGRSGPAAAAAEGSVPLAATERGTGRRWALRCSKR